MREEWPQIQESGSIESEAEARRRGLATPLSNGPGFRIMQGLGWKPGEPLGVDPEGDGLRTPLSIEEPCPTSARRGLGYSE